MPIFEDFEDGNVDGWTGDTGVFSAQGNTVLSGSYSGELTIDTANSSFNAVEYSYPATAGYFELEFVGDQFGSDDFDGPRFRLYDDSGTKIVEVRFLGDGNVYAEDGGGLSNTGYSWYGGVQYTVRVVPDFAAGTFDLIIDGTTAASDYALSNAASGHASVQLSLFANNVSGTYNAVWDDLDAASPQPAAPTNVSQTVEGNDQIQVDADENTTAGSYDTYRIEVSEDSGSWTPVATPSSMPYTYTATESVDSHQFRVRGENSYGSSDWVTTATKSTDITSLTVSNADATSFDLSWDAADDASDYDVLLAEAMGSTEADYSVDQTTTSTGATVTGLENGEMYYARAIARYPSADSLSTVEASTTTALPDPTLDSLDVSVIREVTVNYSLNDNSSDGDVLVELSRDGGSTWKYSQTVSDLSATSVTFTGLRDGEEYTARVTRSTDHATSQSGTMSAITILPAPGGLTHPVVGDTSADYEWMPQHNYGQTRVEYKRTSDSTWQTYSTLDNDATMETVDGLRNGEAYDSRVVAETEHAETVDQ